MRRMWPCLLLTLLAAGCAAPANPNAFNYPAYEPLVNGRLVTVEIVSVNSACYPERSMEKAIAGFAKYVAGQTKVVTGDPLELDADANGLLTTKQIDSAVVERGPRSPSSITIYVVPGLSDFKRRGYCIRRKDGNHTITIHANGITASPPLAVPVNQWWELVIKHELLHALEVPCDSKRNWSRRHCTQPDCILYPRADRRAILVGILRLGPPMDLCRHCRREIDAAHQAAGGELIDPETPYDHMSQWDLLVKLNPQTPNFYNYRGWEHEKAGKLDKSIADYTRAIEVSDNNPFCYVNRAAAFKRQGNAASATSDLDRIEELNSDNAAILNNIAWLLATHPQDDVRDAAHAVRFAVRACELTNWETYQMLGTLAAAYAESGDFDKAIEYQEKAIALIPRKVKDPQASKAASTERLELYRKGKPFRTSR